MNCQVSCIYPVMGNTRHWRFRWTILSARINHYFFLIAVFRRSINSQSCWCHSILTESLVVKIPRASANYRSANHLFVSAALGSVFTSMAPCTCFWWFLPVNRTDGSSSPYQCARETPPSPPSCAKPLALMTGTCLRDWPINIFPFFGVWLGPIAFHSNPLYFSFNIFRLNLECLFKNILF